MLYGGYTEEWKEGEREEAMLAFKMQPEAPVKSSHLP